MRVSVFQYNILLDELSNNFVPRTMEEPSASIISKVFGEEAASAWGSLKKQLSEEYAKWHTIKTLIKDPTGSKLRARGLWSERDLLALGRDGWELEGVEVEDAVTLRCDGTSATSFLGILREHLDKEKSMLLYDAVREVQNNSRAWDIRGPRILKKIKKSKATFVVLEEYDVHLLPTAGKPSFVEAMNQIGYEGANFKGPGQEKSGIGLYWRRKEASLPKDVELPTDRVVQCGMEASHFGNVDMEEPNMREMDRRSLAWAKLFAGGRQIILCGAHLMTGSRDKSGMVRAYELAKIRRLLSSGDRAPAADEAVLFCGDFNINSRGGSDDHIWQGGDAVERTGYQWDGSGARRLVWDRPGGGELRLRDAYGDVNASEECASTRTGTRLETIDYIFYDESLLLPIMESRSTLRCPDEPMPNITEPSDHISLSMSFRVKAKPSWLKVSDIEPESKGINLMLKCISCAEVAQERDLKSPIWEAIVGDETGILTLQLRSQEHAKLCVAGATLRMQNAKVVMIKDLCGMCSWQGCCKVLCVTCRHTA
eukprot:TRINITY_DN75311_c0_g1_i1.p1 TRINITY_DN75311_c0_g1~~TRINITY_DN75311_c0_g1_i1.p1  ORF type:complete len:540 (+),score=99.40 TRINITY_DN75311_c0_g1_i1:76-1695(+)